MNALIRAAADLQAVCGNKIDAAYIDHWAVKLGVGETSQAVPDRVGEG